jgi:hypothetical protein
MFGIANILSFIITLLFVIATNIVPESAANYGLMVLFKGDIGTFLFGGLTLLALGAGVHFVSYMITIPIAILYVAITGPGVDAVTGRTRQERLLMKAQTINTKYMSFEEKQALREQQVRMARFRNDQIDPEAEVHPALRIN